MRPSRWDERWVPVLAERVQRVTARVGDTLDRTAGRGSLVGIGAREQPALAGSIAAVAAAAVILAAAGGPGGPPGEHDATDAPPAPVRLTATLGPAPGASVPAYIDRAAANLGRFVGAGGTTPGVAVIDLRRYLTPAAIRQALGDVRVLRAYVRAPARGLPTQVHAVALPGTFTSLETGMAANGRLAAATAHTFAVLVSQLHPKTPQDVRLRDRYALQQRASTVEADALQRPSTCACVFAVVVSATATQLDTLSRAPEVRVVDVADREVPVDAVTVLPLEPEVTTTVPRGGLLGG